MVKKIVIINYGPFPEGDAGAVRLRFVGRALIDAGFRVEVLCRGAVNDAGCVDGISYKSLRSCDGNVVFRGIDRLLFPGKVKRYFKKNKDVDCIYIYNAQTSSFEYCKRLREKYGICLIHDCVEWYSADEFKNGEKNWLRLSPKRRRTARLPSVTFVVMRWMISRTRKRTAKSPRTI